MRISKVFMLIGVVACSALLYVHQQVELVKLGYTILDKEKESLYLLDRQEKLVYNLHSLERPARLEEELKAAGFAFAFPSGDEVIRVGKAPEIEKNVAVRHAESERQNVLASIADLFGLRAEAQAKEK